MATTAGDDTVLMAYEGSRLCKQCVKFTQHLDPETMLSSESRGVPTSLSFEHQPTFAALEHTASTGCDFCKLLHKATLLSVVKENQCSTEDAPARLHEDDVLDVPFMLSAVPIIQAQKSGHRRQFWHGVSYQRESRHWTLKSPRWYLTSQRNFDLYQSWVQNCSLEHQQCPANVVSTLPTRVLYVGAGSLRLMKSQGRKGEYATLSYCWGAARPYCTTKASLSNHLTYIDPYDLPQLYRDAIEVTRGLGHTYLWIDALCIVQDDETDRQRECSRMDAVYEGSAFTINCPLASNTDYGFLANDRRTLADCTIPISWEAGQPIATALVTLPDDSRVVHMIREEDESVLDDRAWIAQEYVLSPRTLSFGSAQVYFTCNEEVLYESLTCSMNQVNHSDLYSPQRFPHLDKNMLSKGQSDVHGLWYTFLWHYSRRSLTYGDDQLLAIAGIARRVGTMLPGDRYVAGLWASDLVRGLAWQRGLHDQYPVRQTSRHQSPARLATPTWSWVSLDRPIEHRDCFDRGQDRHPTPLLDIVSITGSGTRDEKLRIRGSLLPILGIEQGDLKVQLQDGSLSEFGWVADQVIADLWESNGKPSNPEEGKLRQITKVPGLDSCLLPLSVYEDISNVLALVLEPIPGQASTFRRIGRAERYGSRTHDSLGKIGERIDLVIV
ncbi:hypothetical protein LTR56_007462 [Elasticomyces elasticus]|nr:hypothetical protein LTR56_007462 [Elasticomyces elasticus]KAK3668216.1 hypothetical protein LTR22_000901 [Elasticomyces elasticus]